MNASRITEILNIQTSDMVGYDRVVVHGLKRSANYMIYLPTLSYQLKKKGIKYGSTKIFPVKYRQVWREAKRANIYLTKPDRGNSIVTHQARYKMAKKADKVSRDSRAPGDILHHRAQSTINYYLKEGGSNGKTS